jgi:transposase-like protein
MPHDRRTIVKARRGGQDTDAARELQERYAEEVRADMAREGFTVNSLAQRIGVKPGTLKGYLDGASPWPVGVLKALAWILGRSSDADLVALGYVSSPLAQRFLRQQQQLRLADLVQSKTALLAAREPLVDSPGAQLAATLVTSPDDRAPLVDARLRKLMRGREHPLPFGELLIVDLPRTDVPDYAALRGQLSSIPIHSLAGKASATFIDAVDYYGAMFEEGLDYLARLRRDYDASDTAAMIIVPRLLATRPMDPSALDPTFEHLDGLSVTSIHFGGAPDVAALISRRVGWGYASAGKLTQQTFGTGLRPYGGQKATAQMTERAFHHYCQDLTELLLNPVLSGRRRASALDEPADALAIIRRLTTVAPDEEMVRTPLIMLRISERRIEWTANRRALTRPGGGAWGDEQAVSDYQELVALQDDLTRTVEAVPDRPVAIFTVPEAAVDYDDRERDTTDEDIDAYVIMSRQVEEWLRGLDDEVAE